MSRKKFDPLSELSEMFGKQSINGEGPEVSLEIIGKKGGKSQDVHILELKAKL